MTRSALTLAVLASFSPLSHADEIEKIVVIAPMQTPLTVTTDPKLPRQPLPAQDGADLLSSIAGFSLVKKSAASGDPVFRGMAGSRLNIVTDAGSTLGGCGSRMDPPTAYITPQSFDVLTIIKGPQTVLHGPGNSAATVIFSRENERLQQSGSSGFINLVGGSFGRQGINSDLKFGNQDYFLRFTGSYQESDNYQDGSGNEIHSKYDKWNTEAEFAYTPSNDDYVIVSIGQSDGNVAYGDRMMDGSLFDKEHVGLRWQQVNPLDFVAQLEGKLYYNYIDHVMDNYSLRPFTPSMMMKMPMASNPDRRTVGGKVTLTSEIDPTIELQYGVDFQRNVHRNRSVMNAAMANFNDFARVEDGEFRQAGIFVEGTLATSAQTQWVSGVRMDAWRATDKRLNLKTMMGQTVNPTANETRDDTLFAGFVRHQWQTQNQSYYVGLGHTERFPDYWELIGGARSAPTALSAFNTAAEKTTQLDIGAIFSGDSWRTSTAVFLNEINDYILIDNRFIKMDKATNVVRNIDARSYGFELEAQYQLSKQWQLASSLSYVRGENKTDGKALAQQPPLRLKTSLSYSANAWEFGVLWDVAKGQQRIALGQGNIAGQDISETAGFGTVAINSSFTFSKAAVLSVGIDNLFDKLYAEHLSRAGSAIAGFPQIDRINSAGRTLWVNVDWRF